ncbi:MAG: hypothetical protein HFG65_07235 [Hungatella sp.]|nr:hypothetical protein [Hungatella sp.]
MKDKENVKNIIIGGAGFIIFLLVLILMANIQKEREKNEDWRVEGQVIKREAVTRDDEKNGTEKVYLIDCEDENGVVHTFELTDAALDGNISAKEAFREIETGKAYRFKVGWREKEIMDKPGYYPSIYGAASLVEVNLALSAQAAEAEATADTEETTDGKETTGAKERTSIPETRASSDTENDTKATTAVRERETAETTTALETSTRREAESEERPSKLEIGGIKIEPVEQTVDEELMESLEAQVKKELEESIQAELEESFDMERKSLRKEIENLEEKLK